LMLNTNAFPSLFATSRILLPGKKARIPGHQVIQEYLDE
jgi:hypothetical protein